jgi:outer membrane biosynthesis protein TonB
MAAVSNVKGVGTALLVSCLLHAALALALFHGGGASQGHAVHRGRQNDTAAPLYATLVITIDSSGKAVVASKDIEQKPTSSPRPQANAALDSSQGPAARPGWLPILVPTYYAAEQLTKHPKATSDVELDAPEIRSITASGTLILKLWINEVGAVDSVDIEKSEVPPPVSDSAIAAFKRLIFTPGEIVGRRVASMMRIEITYDDTRLTSP